MTPYSFRLGTFGPGLLLKTPKDRAFFSERNGYKKPLFSYRGYRLFYLERIKK